jgi:hypothetical protein
MPNFFAKYPKVNYDLVSDGSIFELTDISRSVVLNTNKIQDDNALYTYYEIEDGERPDIVSHKLYDDVQYYWTFFIINNFLRDGYASSWPLSYRNFTKMIESEYGKYSALSIVPVVDPTVDLNGRGKLDMSCIPLDEKYLPYLKFVSQDREYRSSIAQYDSGRQQLVIYDCHKVETFGIITKATTNSLTNSSKNWVTNQWSNNQIRITSGTGVGQVRTISSNTATTITVSENWTITPDLSSIYEIETFGTPTSSTKNSLVDLSKKWVPDQWSNSQIKIISGTGVGQARTILSNNTNTLTLSTNWTITPDKYSTYLIIKSTEKIKISAETFIENTNFSYKITYDSLSYDSMPDNHKQTWIDAVYSNIIKYDQIGYAEHIEANTTKEQYVSTKTLNVADPQYRWSNYANAAYEYVDPIGVIRSAYDILTDENVVIPKYKSFYEYENEINESKRVIQVIRPDFISDFADEYFNVLNDTL